MFLIVLVLVGLNATKLIELNNSVD